MQANASVWMYEYEARLYSFECIRHGDAKYGHEMLIFLKK